MTENKEGFARGAEKLRAKTTLKEVLQTAASFEKTAWDFYAALTPKVSKKIRWLVEELAEEEQRHHEMFTDLSEHVDIERQMKSMVDVPASNGRFTDCLHVPDLGENPDDQEVMLYALGREQAAMEQYQSLAESAEPGSFKDMFEFLANEETKHKAELEKLYYELIHSGGV